MTRLIIAVGVVLLTVPNATSAQARDHRHSGQRVVCANAIRRGAAQSDREVIAYAERFAAAGYTAFAINHRAAPRFHYPAPLD